MRKIIYSALILGLSVLSTSIFAQSEKFQTPPQIMKNIIDAKPVPTTVIGSENHLAILSKSTAFLTLKDISYNEYRLGGVRMNPKNFSVTRQVFSDALTIEVNGQKLEIKNLPVNLQISTLKWSPNNKYVAFSNVTENEIELWRIDLATLEAAKINKYKLSGTVLRSDLFQFMGDDKIIYMAVPEDAGECPSTDRLPEGPAVQEVYGKKFGGRTIADIITTPAEEAVFEYLTTSQIVVYSNEGTSKIGDKAIYSSLNLSPDKQYALVRTVHKPFSYITSYSAFPHKLQLMEIASGKIIKTLEDKTIKEEKKDDKTPKPRGYNWRADVASTLYWTERIVEDKEEDNAKSEEEKDEEVEKTFQTSVYQLSAPFDGQKSLVLTSEYGFGGIVWGNENFALYSDNSSKQKISRTLSFNPADNTQKPQLLFVESTKPDSVKNYTVIGRPFTKNNQFGEKVLYLEKGNKKLYFVGRNRPDAEGDMMSFVDAFDMKKKEFTQLWISAAPYSTSIVDILDFKKLTLLVSRQSATTPANLATLRVKDGQVKELTAFTDPVPEIRELGREFVTYTRKDGVGQTALLITPKGYDKERDGRLPVFMWAYPREYRTSVEAEKNRAGRYNFIAPTAAAIMATQGYAVMLDMSMYIVSDSVDNEPNDVFISQLVSNAEAAIDYVVSIGVGDRNRCAVGGHSYGAFMTAHLLSQSDLFTAGIARSGAYNRTLTPFGFQTERRTYWKAPDLYFKMSPFSYVNKLKEPILLIHGSLDENSGTFPVQTQRLYQAISYFGGTSRYVVLPNDTHGYRAKENVYQLWFETVKWLDKYTKNAKPKEEKK